ncbi:amino acid ABC transporter substrate-binding protein [Beijerinckia sp. L45]|uniref:amino acid ABC transporter substrate-binding protein n=1 Tax=Beijerinckia sp. L45 TaxID=1641855 RepID=UPI00131D397D|nr:amino acid ABC transporter substrate-binding protein [Beijerinckia sp. L45]
MKLTSFVTGLTLAVLAGVTAHAEEGVLTGTLKTIQERGTILIGYRTAAIPFAFLNKGGQPVGFSLDICHGIAADVAKKLNLDLVEADAPDWQKGVRITYVPVAPDERLPKVIAGAVDLECGSTTANAERAKTAAFSPVFFLAGVKLMVPLAPAGGGTAAASYRDLAGKRVAVSKGTTTDTVVQRVAKSVSPPFTVIETSNTDDAYAMLVAGTADAFASDDILLSGFIAAKPEGHKFAVVGDYLSYEPYAIMYRKDDPAFADLVQASFQHMAEDNVLSLRYRRWFLDQIPSGETLGLPMSAQLSEMYRALGQPD